MIFSRNCLNIHKDIRDRFLMERTMSPPEDLAGLFIGSWSLVSWIRTTRDGQDEYPYGEDAVGCIMYTADGRMAAHLMRRQRALLRSENSRETTPAERAAAFLDYFSYCGPYTVQKGAPTVTHHVEACSSPNWVGTDRVRTFRFAGDALTLRADRADGSKSTLVWKRN
jgi:Lipocalin-like domain